ncbi:MAG: hypothetical protein ACP5U0_10340, partial [Caldisphaera sp.]
MTIKIALVQPSMHPDTLRRSELIANTFRKKAEVDIFLFKRKGENNLISLFRQMIFLFKIIKREYSIVYFMNLSFVTPKLIKFLSRKSCVVVYDVANIHMGIAITLGRSRIIKTIVKILESSFIKDSDFVTPLGVSFHEYIENHFQRKSNIF